MKAIETQKGPAAIGLYSQVIHSGAVVEIECIAAV